LPYASSHFVAENYVPAGRDVWIAGRMFPTPEPDQVVDVALPGNYVLTDGFRQLKGSVDAGPVADHWHLDRGVHHLKAAGGVPVALVWERAFDRGWRPVTLQQGG
jgi:hypothetical protein